MALGQWVLPAPVAVRELARRFTVRELAFVPWRFQSEARLEQSAPGYRPRGVKPSGRSGAPLATLLVAVAGLAALPISLHFEGNEGTAEPFLVVFPIVALVALAGAVVALRRRTPRCSRSTP